MSGHSKWSTIKHKKAALDARRGGVFTKLASAITVAVKKGSGVEEAVRKAKVANMPKDKIERAIERGMGKSGEGELIEVLLEGYGPEGVAVLVEVVTDNRNRTVAEVKTLFDKAGGNLGEPGSVGYLFERLGEVEYEGELDEQEQLSLIELGAEELLPGLIWCGLGQEAEVVKYLHAQRKGEVEAKVGYRAKVQATVPPSAQPKLVAFLTQLAEHDDVQEVYANWE